jgi:hypothetical protein
MASNPPTYGVGLMMIMQSAGALLVRERVWQVRPRLQVGQVAARQRARQPGRAQREGAWGSRPVAEPVSVGVSD